MFFYHYLKILAYLNKRMISTETLRRNGVMQRCYKDEVFLFSCLFLPIFVSVTVFDKFCVSIISVTWHHTCHLQTAIAFPYRRDGVLVSCKYRGIDKKFWQVFAILILMELEAKHIYLSRKLISVPICYLCVSFMILQYVFLLPGIRHGKNILWTWWHRKRYWYYYSKVPSIMHVSLLMFIFSLSEYDIFLLSCAYYIGWGWIG